MIETVDGSGAAISFRKLGGSGPEMVLLHGFGSDRMSWLANQPALETVASVSALDLPGHGESGMEVGDGTVATLSARIAALLDAKGLSAVHVVGHSLGGGIALTLAAKRPDLVASLVLIAPAGLGAGVDPVFLEAFPALADPVETEALLHRLVVRPRLIAKTLVGRVLDQLAKPGSRDALRAIATGIVDGKPEIEAAAAIVAAGSLPRLVIWGEADTINPLAPERLAAYGGEHQIVADAAHLPQIESPRLVNTQVLDFLARVGPR